MPPKSATLDPNVINSLIEIEQSGQAGFLSQVISLFIDSTPEQIRAIDKAIENSDSAALKANAHSLKSSSAGVGALYLSDLCKELEEQAQAQLSGTDQLKNLLEQLEIEFQNVSSELRKYQTVQD